jgi:hypothetical protein
MRRLVAATATLGFATTLGSFKGMSTATAGDGVGIVDGKPGAHQAVNVVNFAAIYISKAHLVYENVEVAMGDDGVAVLCLVDGHAVLEAGASTASDENAKGEARIILLYQKFANFF